MSLEATALSQPPSASPPPNSSEPAPQPTPPSGANPPASETPPSGDQPDWRALLAGEDAKSLELLSRFKAPTDVTKTLADQRAEITRLQQQKGASGKFPENPTPEAIAEWRKSIGVPDIAKDAKPEAYLEAFKIKTPEGYEMSEVEKGMLSDYAKLAYEQGHSPREVTAAVDFFFRQQSASNQALNKIAVDFQKAEQNGWRDAVGSKEYEAQVSAASDWLKDQFKDSPEMVDQLLQARLPNGGRLGDSRWFGETLAKLAMGDGYTDRIMANSLESGGKSLAHQQREIEAMQFTNRAAYNEAAKPGGALDQIIKARISRGEIDENGNEVRKRA